jgi:hypothetical protein
MHLFACLLSITIPSGSFVTTVFSWVYIAVHSVNIYQPCIALLQQGVQMVQLAECCAFSVLTPLPPSPTQL